MPSRMDRAARLNEGVSGAVWSALQVFVSASILMPAAKGPMPLPKAGFGQEIDRAPARLPSYPAAWERSEP